MAKRVYIRWGPTLYAVMERDVDADGVTLLVWELQVSDTGYGVEQSSPGVFDGRLFVGTFPFGVNDYHLWAIKDP